MRNKRKMIEGQERQLEKQDRLIAMIAGHDDDDDDDCKTLNELLQ